MFDKPNRRDKRSANLQNREDIREFVTEEIDKLDVGIYGNIDDRHNEGTPVRLDARCVQTLRSSFDPFEYTRGESLGNACANRRERRRAVLDEALDKLIDRLPETNWRRA